MNVWYFHFEGHYPVGAVGVVVAYDLDEAIPVAEAKLKEIGLPQNLLRDDFVRIDNLGEKPMAEILLDGNYFYHGDCPNAAAHRKKKTTQKEDDLNPDGE